MTIVGNFPRSDGAKHTFEKEALASVDTEVGQTEEVTREYSLFSAYSFAVSISGLFSTVGTSFYYPLAAGGGACIPWAWFVSGFGSLLVAFSVAEIVSAYPTSGGTYHATAHLFPKRIALFMSWTDGWLSFLGQIAITASSEYGAAEMLLTAASMGSDFSYTPTSKQYVGVVSAILLFHGFIVCLPVKYVERLNRGYTVFHFAALISGAVALLAKTRPRHDATYVFTHIEDNSGWTPTGFSFLFGFLSAAWSMTLYDGTAHLADSLRQPERTAPWAISAGMLTTYILGFLYNIVLSFCMGNPQAIINETLPVSAIYYNSLGRAGGIVFTVFMFIVMNFVGVSVLQSTSYSIWAQAHDDMFGPGSKQLIWRFSRTGTPILSVALATFLCICVNLIGLGSTTTINAIFNVTAIALDWSAIIPVIGKVCYPQLFKRGPWHLGPFSTIINCAAIVWVAFVTVLFCMPYSMPATALNMNYACVFLAFTVAGSSLWWVLGAQRTYLGPQFGNSGFIGVRDDSIRTE